MALLTTTNVTDWLPQAAGLTNAFLVEAIAMAQGAADELCHRTLESGARDEYYDGGTNVVILKNAPVTTFTSFYGNAHMTSPVTLVEDTDFYVDDEHGRVVAYGDGWAYAERSLHIAYTAGYTVSTLPAGLKKALLSLVGWIIDSRGDRGLVSTSMDGESETRLKFYGGMPADVAAEFATWIRNGG
jgi:hypothetical protein